MPVQVSASLPAQKTGSQTSELELRIETARGVPKEVKIEVNVGATKSALVNAEAPTEKPCEP